jgi:hypothetical protein
MIQEKFNGAFRFPVEREELVVLFFEWLSCPSSFLEQIIVASDRNAC